MDKILLLSSVTPKMLEQRPESNVVYTNVLEKVFVLMYADLSLGHDLGSESCDGRHKPQLEASHWGYPRAPGVPALAHPALTTQFAERLSGL